MSKSPGDRRAALAGGLAYVGGVPHFPRPSVRRLLSRFAIPLVAAAGALAPLAPLHAQDVFERRELTIPVRDGMKLFAVALVPKSMATPLPIMLIRTPYSAAGAFRTAQLPASYKELAEDGYIFVTEDVRGRYGSDGQFVMNGALHDPKNPNGVDEATDTYDTIDWLVKNMPNNSGKVGVMGVSYPGWLAGIAGVNPHPALKAISPQAPMTDTWMGDDFFHQGAFRQSFGLEYAPSMEMTKDSRQGVPINRYDRYDWYMQFPTLKELGEKNGIEKTPSWVAFSTHPAWDAWWQAKAMQNVLTSPDVAVLNVGGFWDQEDVFGPQEAYRTLEKKDTKNWNHIVLGPWFHGGWSGPGDNIGPLKFGDGIGLHFRETIQRPFFAFYLHGKGDGKFAEAYIFESGENKWHTFDAWPPREAKPRSIYLRENGMVSFDPPPTAGCDSYVSDPKHPIPYIARPVDGTRWRQWLVEDQRFVDNRSDVLTWRSDPLNDDVVIAGDVTAHLFAKTTGTDADWVVKLIDVYPESVQDNRTWGGYELMTNADILRGRYYKSWSVPHPIPANTVTPFTVDLHEQLYRFLKGHRIMVQVQSTWFPLYDRNPQTYVANIFEAKASDFKAQTHSVCHGPGQASHIAVGVLP
jgi:putative CocE/NonD family hydrolase